MNLKEDYNFESHSMGDTSKQLLEEKEEQIKMLKDILKKKDERIDVLLEQLSYSQLLINQQQQLDQYRNKLYLSHNTDSEKDKKYTNKKWWMFWK